MNKLLLLPCVFLFLFGEASAQSNTKDELMKTMATETCQELSKSDLKNKTADELKLALGLPLVVVAGRHQAELQKFGINMADKQGAETLGRDIGFQLAASCPNFVTAMFGNAGTLSEIVKSNNASKVVTQSISGKLVEIVKGDFTYLQVEDGKGKLEKLYWMEYFEGANILVINPQSRLQKPITVNYVEKEIFNSALKDYLKVKIITGIE